MVTAAALAVFCAQAPAAQAGQVKSGQGRSGQVRSDQVRSNQVPLPRPRPVEADKPAPGEPTGPAAEAPAAVPAAAQPEPKQLETKQPEPKQLSACRQALTAEIAIAPSIPDIHGPGGCGGEDLVRLEAIMLPDQRRVAVNPPATLRCAMASAVADWVRSDVVPIAAGLGSEPAALDNFDSFECRGRNRVAGAPLSEHGRANALDLRGIKLANGQTIALTDRHEPREVRESVLHSVCARFPTVLGPGSDWYHEDHIHLDLMFRRNDYRICQWNVWDPLPQVAPLLPAARPGDAPPRKLAGEDQPDDAATAAPAKSDDAKDDTKDDFKPEPAATRPPTKKRR